MMRNSSEGKIRQHPREVRTVKDRRTIDVFWSVLLEDLFLHQTKKVDEGHNGVIFFLDRHSLPTKILQKFKQLGVQWGEGDRAVKVLKVYRKGSGEQEFHVQQRAYEAIAAEPHPDQFARIPEPSFFRDITVGDRLQKVFSDSGIRVSEKRAELFGMEFIEGKDLARILYESALWLHPKNEWTKDDLSGMSIMELQTEVAQLLQFHVPGKKSHDEAERKFEERKVHDQNSEILCLFLKRRGFTLHSSIMDRIERTMNTLHEQGIAHRDLHYRNVLIQGDPSKPDAVPYVLDFGQAAAFEGKIRPEVFESAETGNMFLHDGYLVGQLRKYFRDEDLGKKEEDALKQRLSFIQYRIEGLPKIQTAIAWFEYGDTNHFEQALERAYHVVPMPKMEGLCVVCNLIAERRKKDDIFDALRRWVAKRSLPEQRVVEQCLKFRA